ncbi:MAG: endonuclease/exonuclease/phosphatase family protein, partial [Planctomycetales bacterium]
FLPDVLCIQELRQKSMELLDEVLPGYCRVEDPYPGWTQEGNIYWNGGLLEEVEHGAEEIGIVEELRRLFWVRLKLVGQKITFLVANAHFTYQGHAQEIATGQSPRREQTLRTVEALQRLAGQDEPVLLCGDLNDPYLPAIYLHAAGYQSCFSDLGLLCPPTWPCYPTSNFAAGHQVANQTIDWIYHNQHLRTVSAQVPHCYHGDIAPSDHWPVQAVYELRSTAIT